MSAKRALCIACLCVAWVLLGLTLGCGQNIIKPGNALKRPIDWVNSGNIDKAIASAVEHLENSSGYDDILEATAAILSTTSNATTSQKQRAQALKGEALMGKNEVVANTFLEQLQVLSDSSTTSNAKNIFQFIRSSASLAVLAEASDAFNIAASGNLVSQLSVNELDSPFTANTASLNASGQINRGVVNLYTALKIFQEIYVVDVSGNITATTANAGNSNYQNLSQLITPNGLNAGMDHYAVQAIDGFESSAVFTNSQLAQIQKVKTASVQFKSLFDSSSNGGTFSWQQFSHTFTAVQNSQQTTADATQVQLALKTILDTVQSHHSFQ